MSFKLVFAFSLAAATSAAQGFRRDPAIVIDLSDVSRLRAWLSMSVSVPPPVAEAFTRAMRCPPTANPSLAGIPNSVHVDCPSPAKKDGLVWSRSWDFTALNAELLRAGEQTVDVNIHHARAGYWKISPDSDFETYEGALGISHNGKLGVNDFHTITVEAGIGEAQVRRLGEAAGVVLLLALVMFAARARGPLQVMAATNVLFCLAATVWLAVTLPLNVSAVLPMPGDLLLLCGPLLIGVWIGSLVTGGPRRSIYFWRGTRAVAVIGLLAGFFGSGSSLIPWITCCAATVIACFWQLRRAGGNRLESISEGELVERIHQLAARAGVKIRTVHLILGSQTPPAAFASRFGGILLTGSLLGTLSRREVDSVICHELSHVRRPRTAVIRGFGIFMIGMIVTAFIVPGSLEWIPLLLLPAVLVDRSLRRRTERTADADAVRWGGDPEALITGLTRITRANQMPIEWPGWVKPLMPHPSTMQRLRTAAALGSIPEERFQQLLMESADPPADAYPITLSSGATASAFSTAVRSRLNSRLKLVGAGVPILAGVAAPFIGYITVLLIGALSSWLISEWLLWRAHSRARALLPGRPGVFVGFGPTLASRKYEGSYDYDCGFAAFENDSLVFRGDRSNWSVCRSEIARIWLAEGPSNWVARPLVCFQTRSGPAFWLRPFDDAFGPKASRASARLREQASHWHNASDAGAPAPMNFDFAAVKGEIPPVYTWRMLARGLPMLCGITALISWTVAAMSLQFDFSESQLLGPPAVTAALLLFVAYPGIRRGRRELLSRSAPLAPAP